MSNDDQGRQGGMSWGIQQQALNNRLQGQIVNDQNIQAQNQFYANQAQVNQGIIRYQGPPPEMRQQMSGMAGQACSYGLLGINSRSPDWGWETPRYKEGDLVSISGAVAVTRTPILEKYVDHFIVLSPGTHVCVLEVQRDVNCYVVAVPELGPCVVDRKAIER